MKAEHEIRLELELLTNAQKLQEARGLKVYGIIGARLALLWLLDGTETPSFLLSEDIQQALGILK